MSNKPKLRDILQNISDQDSSKLSKSWAIRKFWEIVTDQRRLSRRELNKMWYPELDPRADKGH